MKILIKTGLVRIETCSFFKCMLDMLTDAPKITIVNALNKNTEFKWDYSKNSLKKIRKNILFKLLFISIVDTL